MKVTNIESVIPYLKGSRFIGIGYTAMCFLMNNGKVFKLYIETFSKKNLFECISNPIEHFSKINEIKNETYIAPDELLLKNGKVIGYLYDYINGKTLRRLNYSLDLLINSYDKLIEDTYKISEQGFDLFDVHDKNILFDNKFRIIDLDKGEYKEYGTERIFNSNMSEINKTIIYNVFSEPRYKEIRFCDCDRKELYNQSLYTDVYKMKELLKDLKKVGTKRKQLTWRKDKVITSYPSYYGGF